MNVGDATTGTGGSTTNTVESQSEDMDDTMVDEHIRACAAEITDEIIEFGQSWLEKSEKYRLVAASACPKALEAELL